MSKKKTHSPWIVAKGAEQKALNYHQNLPRGLGFRVKRHRFGLHGESFHRRGFIFFKYLILLTSHEREK